MLREVGDHAAWIFEIIGIEGEIPHSAFDVFAEPVQVENNGIDRHFLRAELGDDFTCFLFAVVTKSAGKITEGPTRWQWLLAGEAHIVRH